MDHFLGHFRSLLFGCTEDDERCVGVIASSTGSWRSSLKLSTWIASFETCISIDFNIEGMTWCSESGQTALLLFFLFIGGLSGGLANWTPCFHFGLLWWLNCVVHHFRECLQSNWYIGQWTFNIFGVKVLTSKIQNFGNNCFKSGRPVDKLSYHILIPLVTVR